jgi:hypothetical protein
MRTMLVAGTAGVFLALSAASAYAVPPNSPYATMVPPGAVDGEAPYYGQPRGEVIIEGRSAYVEDDPGYVYRAPAYRAVRPDYVYVEPAYRYRAPFPFSLLPWNW